MTQPCASSRWRGVERAGLDLQHVLRGGADLTGDRVAVRGSKHQRAKDQEVGSALEQLDARRVVAHASCGQSYGRCVDGLHKKSDPRSSPGNMTGPELVFESIVPQGIVHHDAYGVPDDRAC